MRKLLLLIAVIALPVLSQAQYLWDFGGQVGASNYLGEMGGKEKTRRNFISDIKLSKTEFTVGAFARYKVNPLLSLKLAANWVRIEGEDNKSTNPGRVGRNLSFQNNIIELEFTGQVYFYDVPDLGHTYRYRNDFKMYAFAGVTGFYSNPRTHYDGQWVNLQPLETEGKHYSRIDLAIPVGLGLYFTINKRHRIGWEFSWRTTFTDYLDDVSTTYAKPEDLTSEEARVLANRRNELGDKAGVPAAANYEPGAKRGDPSHNDSYLSTSVYYSYVLRGRSSFYRSKYGSIFKHKKYKKRKIRAKF
ncbi:MAG: hypothetical protein JWP12_208 [Bacteroidetes bacterium]|nr:hypothetical protein [Bacteroidota bacterium]